MLMRGDNLKKYMKRHEKYHESESVNMQSMDIRPLIKPSESKCNYASEFKGNVKRHMNVN
jgi:hypothetical protein